MDDRTRALVKALFGRPLRLSLARWILGMNGAAFIQQDAQDAMRHDSESPSAVAKELRSLVEWGLLTRADTARRVYYRAAPSPWWEVFEVMVRVLEHAEGASEVADPPGVAT